MVHSAIGIAWRIPGVDRDVLAHSVTDDANESYVEKGGVQATFRRELGGNFTSTIHIRDPKLNNTLLTCEGVYYATEDGNVNKITKANSTTICLTGSYFFIMSTVIK